MSSEKAVADPGPEVSVIIPARDLEGYVDDAIRSVLDQDFGDFELIVVDDGSTDGTASKVEAWMRRDRRVRLLANRRRPGVSGARNTGIDAARGAFVAFLDADDTWFPGSLRARVARLKSIPERAFVHGPLRLVDETLAPLGPEIATRKTIGFENAIGNPASLNVCLFPRPMIGDFRLREDLDSGEDWLFVAQILRTGVVSHFVPDGGATYRVRPDSKVNRDLLAHERTLDVVLDWVFGPDDDPRYHPDHRQGIRSHERKTVVARRKLRSLGDALIMRREPEARALLSEIVEHDLLRAAGIKAGDRFSAVSLCRHFRVPVDQVRERALPIRDEMAAVIVSVGADRTAPDLVESLWRSTFSESWADVMRTTRDHRPPRPARSAATAGKRRKPSAAAKAPGRSAKGKHGKGKRRAPTVAGKRGGTARRRDGIFRTWPVAIAAAGAALVLLAVVIGLSASGEALPALVLATGIAMMALVSAGILHDASRRRLKARRDAARTKARALRKSKRGGEQEFAGFGAARTRKRGPRHRRDRWHSAG